MRRVPEIKLIRTDTTLDLSQKAEKVCLSIVGTAHKYGAQLGLLSRVHHRCACRNARGGNTGVCTVGSLHVMLLFFFSEGVQNTRSA